MERPSHGGRPRTINISATALYASTIDGWLAIEGGGHRLRRRARFSIRGFGEMQLSAMESPSTVDRFGGARRGDGARDIALAGEPSSAMALGVRANVRKQRS